MSLAAVEQLKQQEPEVVASAAGAAGLSLGEYTALAFADAMSFEDGLRIVQARGKAMQRAADLAPSGMMSILGLDVDKGQAICDELASLVGSASPTFCARVTMSCQEMLPRSTGSRNWRLPPVP